MIVPIQAPRRVIVMTITLGNNIIIDKRTISIEVVGVAKVIERVTMVAMPRQ